VTAKLLQRPVVAMFRRHFPLPWTIEKHNDACFIVRDATGQALGISIEEEPRGRSLGLG